MFMHVPVVVFLSLSRVRISNSKSVAEVIRSRYSENTIKKTRKLEKLDYCLRKLELDLQFFRKCDGSNVIPFFFFFFLISFWQIVLLNIHLPSDFVKSFV